MGEFQDPKFQRHTEDFACAKCGTPVKGNGYTDHCPACLWSQHVDTNPGDRANPCRGMMEPVWAERKGTGYRVYYRCQKCAAPHRVKALESDDADAILKAMCRPVDADFLKAAGKDLR
jgi:hypothetical protein